jgi:hypothetical protein
VQQENYKQTIITDYGKVCFLTKEKERKTYNQITNTKIITLKNKIKNLPDGELNPGLPRDRRGYSPLYYLGLYF